MRGLRLLGSLNKMKLETTRLEQPLNEEVLYTVREQ